MATLNVLIRRGNTARINPLVTMRQVSPLHALVLNCINAFNGYRLEVVLSLAFNMILNPFIVVAHIAYGWRGDN